MFEKKTIWPKKQIWPKRNLTEKKLGRKKKLAEKRESEFEIGGKSGQEQKDKTYRIWERQLYHLFSFQTRPTFQNQMLFSNQ